MNMQVKNTVGILLLMLLLGTAGTDSALAAKVRKDVHKSFPLAMGGEVSIENVNGDVEVSGWDKDSVDMDIEITVKHDSQKRAEEFMEKIELIFEVNANYIDVEVDYPGRNSGGLLSWLFGFGEPTVDVQFLVKVPKRSNLDLRTVNGQIAVDGTHGEIDCKTTNGGIDISNVQGKVSSNTVNGGISVELEDVQQFDEMNFHTVNGGIHLALPKDIKATLEASTVNGGIDSELPMEIDGRISHSKLNGKINGGGGLLVLKTVNGGITLSRSR